MAAGVAMPAIAEAGPGFGRRKIQCQGSKVAMPAIAAAGPGGGRRRHILDRDGVDDVSILERGGS